MGKQDITVHSPLLRKALRNGGKIESSHFDINWHQLENT